MDFKAEKVNGELIVKAITVKDEKGNVTVHVPSFPLINKLKKELEDGKRNIQ